jgi:outer membrane protein assembly factor BamE (lipoprotein component of BamABCDE complex)
MRSVILLSLALLNCSSGARFDAHAWKNADLTGRERADMLDDFTSRYHLPGMSKAEVVQHLGPPTQTDKWGSADMVYVLGNDGSYMPIDNEWLLIDLNDQQRVESFKRSRD